MAKQIKIINKPKDPSRYIHYVNKVIMLQKNVMRERIKESLKLIKAKIYRGDFHVHSTYSDGVGSVKEIKQYIDASGLDFAFITEHHTLRQKNTCKRFKNLWWGQEPGSGLHHLGILNLKRYFKPTGNFIHDYKKVQKLGGVPFIPHPTGWFPTTRYTKKQIGALVNLGDKFTMEIVNGANNIFDCYDITDENSIKLWDKFLSEGKEITVLGNSDAHLPQALGDIWNGVVVNKLNKDTILNALQKGRLFVSDCPVILLRNNKYSMGDKIFLKKGSKISLQIKCADSIGLATVRIVKNGRIFKEYDLNDKKFFNLDLMDKFNGINSYYRAECYSKDFRKAWTNPIYLRRKL